MSGRGIKGLILANLLYSVSKSNSPSGGRLPLSSSSIRDSDDIDLDRPGLSPAHATPTPEAPDTPVAPYSVTSALGLLTRSSPKRPRQYLPIERPQEDGEWWSCSLADWEGFTDKKKKAKSSHVGRLMETKDAEVVTTMDPGCTECTKRGRECKMYTAEFKKTWTDCGDACAGCRHNNTSCSLSARAMKAIDTDLADRT